MVDVARASVDALVDNGVLAYKEKDFKIAIKTLEEVLDIDSRHWRAKLYLAMSYYHCGEPFAAFRHFVYLRDNCTDQDIRAKAIAALAALNEQMQPKTSGGVSINSRMPEMTCTMKKPVAPPKSIEIDEENPELEWVSTKVN